GLMLHRMHTSILVGCTFLGRAIFIVRIKIVCSFRPAILHLLWVRSRIPRFPADMPCARDRALAARGTPVVTNDRRGHRKRDPVPTFILSRRDAIVRADERAAI